MARKHLTYFICQFLGWGFYLFLSGFSYYLNNSLTQKISLALLAIFISGILITHFYRRFIIKMGWLKFSPLKAVLPILASAVVMGIVMALAQRVLSALIFNQDTIFEGLTFSMVVMIWLNWFVIFIIWSILYFAFHFFEKSRNEEIKNLRLEAMKTEVELNNLKAQLNPHFMFNSMNSIRALIEENPELAKESITKLSNILRSTLVMGRKQLVSLSEELEVIHDYLKLESIRYEERLKIRFEIDEQFLQFLIPPLMIQTLVENAIKHGISKLHDGGEVAVIIQSSGNSLVIRIENTGHLSDKKSESTGIGLANTKQRLELLYENKAEFKIFENNNKVIAEIKLPLLKTTI